MMRLENFSRIEGWMIIPRAMEWAESLARSCNEICSLDNFFRMSDIKVLECALMITHAIKPYCFRCG